MYVSSLVGPALLILALTVAYAPFVVSRALGCCLAALVAALVVQLIPLPTALVAGVSPAALAVAQHIRLSPLGQTIPLSIDVTAGVWALGVATGTVLMLLVSRTMFERGGVRFVIRGIAATGLALAAIALAQDATAHGLMYWHWKPIEEGAPPFGPFVDRNHFATWIVLAVPLCAGYLIAHVTAHSRAQRAGAGWRRALVDVLDGRAMWLAMSLCLMLVALVASLSRSGLVAIAVALMTMSAASAARRGAAAAGRWVTLALALACVAAAIRVDPGTIVQRLNSAGGAAAGRVAIWHETLPVVRDFWVTGAGAGTFETAMLAYQRAPAPFRINAAHNHYLQVAAEGGLLVGIPVLAAIVLFARAAMQSLRQDHSGTYWIKAGALSGLAGVAVQSVWETGLTTPANGLLAAVAAAIALHRARG